MAISLVWTQAQSASWQHPSFEGFQPTLAFKGWLLCLREERLRPKTSPLSPPDFPLVATKSEPQQLQHGSVRLRDSRGSDISSYPGRAEFERELTLSVQMPLPTRVRGGAVDWGRDLEVAGGGGGSTGFRGLLL